MIDRESGKPLYQQLADILRSKINDGTYPPGKLIPSELHLQQEFDLARDTVRAAFDVLREEGLIITYPGRGSAVAKAENNPGP